MKRQQQKVRDFRDALKTGDRVVTSGGMYGSITRVSDESVQLQPYDPEQAKVEDLIKAVKNARGMHAYDAKVKQK